LFEVEDLRDEPLTGWTDDPSNYGYTHHYYTKDLVCRIMNVSRGDVQWGPKNSRKVFLKL